MVSKSDESKYLEEPKAKCSKKIKMSICCCSFLALVVVVVIVLMVTGAFASSLAEEDTSTFSGKYAGNLTNDDEYKLTTVRGKEGKTGNGTNEINSSSNEINTTTDITATTIIMITTTTNTTTNTITSTTFTPSSPPPSPIPPSSPASPAVPPVPPPTPIPAWKSLYAQSPAWKSLYELDASCFQNVQERARETGVQTAMVPNELMMLRETSTPTANGMVADVTFELAGLNGKRAAACEDFVRVVMMSGNEAVVVPRITVHPSGIYHVSASLWRTQQRLWNVFVLLEHKTFDIDFWTEILHVDNTLGCETSVPPWTTPNTPMFTLDPFATSQPTGLTLQSTVANCTRTQLIAANGHSSAQVTAAHRLTWGPPECKLHPASTVHVLHVLHNKWVLMIGDSTLEELFYGILSYSLGVDPNFGFPWRYGIFHEGMHPTLFAAANSEFVAESQACPLSVCRSRYYDSRKGALPNGIRLTFLWNADASPCGAYVGLSSFKFRGFQERLQSLLDEGPDVVVFNSGMHDIRGWWTLNEYSEKLHAAWDFLQQKPLRHYIWKSTAPLFKGAECETSNFLGNAGLKILNQVANAIASVRGADIYDQWAVRYISPEDGDGVHCRPGASYYASLSLLLRHIELGPKQ